MRYVAITLLAIIAMVASADDFLWLEREWISDADATMVANPQIKNLDGSTLAEFKNIFGEMRWRFSDGILHFVLPGATEPLSNPYFVRSVDDERFEIVIEIDHHQNVFAIWRSADGFCTRPEPDWIPDDLEAWARSFIVECFKPYGA